MNYESQNSKFVWTENCDIQNCVYILLGQPKLLAGKYEFRKQLKVEWRGQWYHRTLSFGSIDLLLRVSILIGIE